MCFKDIQCPASYPFRIVSDNVNCYDCLNTSLLIPTSNLSFYKATTPNLTQTVGNCLSFDPTVKMNQYDPINGGSINQCFTKCIDCNQYYYADTLCYLCNLKFANCLTCNQTIACLTCNSTKYYISPTGCQLCTFGYLNCFTCSNI